MSELPDPMAEDSPVLVAIKHYLRRHLGTWTPGELSREGGLVRALLDAKVLVLMDDHMEVIRDRDEWEDADEEACEDRDRAHAEVARLREALEWIASRYGDGPTPDWEFLSSKDALRVITYARAALDATEPAT